MSLVQTESTTMKAWEELGWTITPLNFPVLIVEPPATSIDLRNTKLAEELSSNIKLIDMGRKRKIDTLTHQTLLKESLESYSDIWKILADK